MDEKWRRGAIFLFAAKFAKALTAVIILAMEEDRKYRAQSEQLEKELKKKGALIKELQEKIANLRRDYLTGLNVRSTLPEEQERRRRSSKQWSVLLLDIDRFKQVNDALGHEAGDEVLKQTADHLNKIFRETDSIIRYGGEEFAVVLKDATPQDILDKLFDKEGKISRIGFEAEYKGGKIIVTFSGGITSFKRDEEIADSIRRADEALYISKNTGRNRIITWSDNINGKN